jgi:hypothetical protein
MPDLADAVTLLSVSQCNKPAIKQPFFTIAGIVSAELKGDQSFPD